MCSRGLSLGLNIYIFRKIIQCLNNNDFLKWALKAVFPYNANPATKVFRLDGSNKTHPTNIIGRASTTLSVLAMPRFDCDRSLFVSLNNNPILLYTILLRYMHCCQYFNKLTNECKIASGALCLNHLYIVLYANL